MLIYFITSSIVLTYYGKRDLVFVISGVSFTWQSCYPAIVVCLMALQYCFPGYRSEMFSFYKLDNPEKHKKVKIARDSTILNLSQVAFC